MENIDVEVILIFSVASHPILFQTGSIFLLLEIFHKQ